MKENIDKLFKDALQNRDFDFDEQDWKAFQAMQQAPKQKRRALAWWRVPIAATLLLGIGLATYFSNTNVVVKDNNNWRAERNANTDLKDSKKSDVAVLDKNSPPISTKMNTLTLADKAINMLENNTNNAVTSSKNTKSNPSATNETIVETVTSSKNPTSNPSVTNETIVETFAPPSINTTANKVNVEEVITTPSEVLATTPSNSLVPTEKTNLSETINTILNDTNKATNTDFLTQKNTPKHHWTWDGISIAAGFAPEQYQKSGQSLTPTATSTHTIVNSSTVYAAIGTNFARQMSAKWRFITGLRYSYRGGRVYSLSELQLAAETQNSLFTDPLSQSTNFTISRYRKLHSLEIPLYFDYALTSVWGVQLGINNSFALAASQDKYEPFNTNTTKKDFSYDTSTSFEPFPYRRYVPALLLGADLHWKKKNSVGAEITYSVTSNYQDHSQLKILASPTVKRFLGRLVYTRKF